MTTKPFCLGLFLVCAALTLAGLVKVHNGLNKVYDEWTFAECTATGGNVSWVIK